MTSTCEVLGDNSVDCTCLPAALPKIHLDRVLRQDEALVSHRTARVVPLPNLAAGGEMRQEGKVQSTPRAVSAVAP